MEFNQNMKKISLVLVMFLMMFIMINNVSADYGYSLCYQESVNISNQGGIDGNCSLNYNGNYIPNVVKGWNNGNWGDTWTIVGLERDQMNYTKPKNAVGAVWLVRDSGGYFNLTIPPICFNNKTDTLLLSVDLNGTSPYTNWTCWGGNSTLSPGWMSLRTYTSNARFYEEAIYWNISSPPNISFINSTTTVPGTYQNKTWIFAQVNISGLFGINWVRFDLFNSNRVLVNSNIWPTLLNDGIVAYFNFENGNNVTATDNVYGTSNFVITNGASINTTTGKIGKGFDFDGSATKMTNTSYTSQLQNETNMTWTIWIYPHEADCNGPATYDSVLAGGATLGWLDLRFIGSTCKISFDTTVGGDLSSTSDLVPNTWNFVAITYGGGTKRLYVNSTEESNEIGDFGGSGLTTVIGKGGNGYFNGVLDEIGIWNRTLSAAEIALVYNSGIGSSYNPSTSNIFSYNFTSLSDGRYYFNVTVSDNQSTRASTETRDVLIDTQAPNMTLIIPLNFNVSNITAVNFTVNINTTSSNPNLTNYTQSYWYADNLSGLARGVLVYYQMEDNTTTSAVVDRSSELSYGNLTMTNTTQISEASPFGSSFNFTNNTYITMLNSSTLNNVPTGTSSVWVYAMNNSNKMYIFSREQTSTSTKWNTYYNASGYYGWTSIATDLQCPTPTLELNRWQMITHVWNGVNQSIYINGRLNCTLNSDLGIPNSIQDTIIGAVETDRNLSWKGRMDEMVFWNRSLSASEILSLYTSYGQVTPIANATLYIYNNNTGTLVNQTTIVNPIMGTYQATVTIVVNLVDGIYHWFYKAFDLAGNMGTSEQWKLEVDATGPNVSFITPTTPVSGMTNNNSFYILVNTSDNYPFNWTRIDLFNSTRGLINSSQSSSYSWWNNSFAYRKEINISGTVISNYSIHLVIPIVSGKMNETGKDLRFIDSTQTRLLPYYVWGYNTTILDVWVKVDDNNSIYMYYGNSNAEASSNIYTAFIVADDFNGNTLNTSIWTLSGVGATAVVSNGILNLTGGASGGTVYSAIKYSINDTIVEARWLEVSGGVTNAKLSNDIENRHYRMFYSSPNFRGTYYDGGYHDFGNVAETGTSFNNNSLTKETAAVNGADGLNLSYLTTCFGCAGTSSQFQATAFSGNSGNNYQLSMYSESASKTSNWDWIVLRRYLRVVPITTIGTEKSLSYATNITANFSSLPDGKYYFNATAMSYNGQMGASETRDVLIDTKAPNLSLIVPANYTVNFGTWLYPNVPDVSGNNNNGTAIGGVIINSTYAKFGNGGASFDGVNDYVNLSLTGFSNLTQGYAFSSWINTNINSSAGTKVLVFKNKSGSYPIFELGVRDNGVGNGLKGSFRFDLNSSGCGFQNVYSITTNLNGTGWHLITGFYNVSNMVIYLDGVYNNKANVPVYCSALLNSYGNIDYLQQYMGNGASANQFFNGSIDEVRIFNRTLSQAEITSLYTTNSIADTTGLVAYYDMEPDTHAINFTVNVSAGLGDGLTSNLSNATLYVYNNQTGVLVNQTTTTFAAGVYQSMVGTMLNLVDGIYHWFYTAFDLAGNMGTSEQWNVEVDAAGPNISFITPPTTVSGTIKNTTNIYVNINVSDGNGMNYSIIELFNSSRNLINSSIFNYTTLDSGLVAYYNFNDGTANDSSGNMNQGTAIGGVIINSTYAKFGNGGANFDGVNGKINSTYIINGINQTDFTFSLWFKKGINTTGLQSIFSAGYSTTDAYRFEESTSSSNSLRFTVLNSTGSVLATSSTAFLPVFDTWYFVTGSFNGSRVVLYVNGVLNSTSGLINGNVRNNNKIVLANQFSTTTKYYNGSIDEVRIFNRTLSQAEITSLYYRDYEQFNDQSTINFTSLPDGRYYFNATSVDVYGLKNSSETRDVLIDTKAPNLSLIVPANYTVNFGTWLYPNVPDVSGNNNNGTAIGGVIINSTYAKFGNGGASFDGVNDYVQINETNQINGTMLANGFTISAWINARSVGEGGSGRIIDKSSSTTGGNGFLYAIGGGGTTMFIQLNGGNTRSSGTTIVYGSWIHVLVTVNSSQIATHYINGVVSGTPGDLVQPISAITTTNAMRIGNRAGATDRTFNGSIDEVRIINRVLSQAEITSLYTTNSIADTTGLVAYYDMEPDTHAINFTVNVSAGLGDGLTSNLSNATLYVYNNRTGVLVNQTTTTFAAGVYQSMVGTIVDLIGGIYHWFYTAFDLAGNMGTSEQWILYNPNITVSRLQQWPADITSSNIIVGGVNVTYNITSALPLNITAITIQYKVNSTTRTVVKFVNGTNAAEWGNDIFTSNLSSNFTWHMDDNELLPGTYNLDDDITDTSVHTNQTLTTNNAYVFIGLNNVTNTTKYNFFEIMSNSSSIQQIYYCNSSYTFAGDTVPNPSTSPRCTLVGTIPAAQAYNHQHSSQSYHQLVVLVINTTTGKMGTVSVTPSGYFALRGNNGGTNVVNYYTVANFTRTNATLTTTNNGGTFTAQTFTVDAHLHQFDDEDSLYYYACANDTYGSSTCSSVSQDLYELAGLPPQAGIVYLPNSTNVYTNNVTINWTAWLSPNDYPIILYNITLLNNTLGFNRTLTTNNSINQSYVWNSTNVFGNWIIKVTGCDNLTQCSDSYSNNFTITAEAPSISNVQITNDGGTSGTSFIYNQNIVNISATITVTDPSITIRANITVTDPDGIVIISNKVMSNVSSIFNYSTPFNLNKVGNYIINISAYGSSGIYSESINTISVSTITQNVISGFYGYDTQEIPSNATLSALAMFGYNVVEIYAPAVNSGTNITSNWTVIKGAILYANLINLRIGLKYNINYNLSNTTITGNFTNNITALFPDLKTAPYLSTVSYIKFDVNSSLYNDSTLTTNGLNKIGKAASDATNGLFQIYSNYNSTNLSTSYIEYASTFNYITGSNQSTIINTLANLTRNTISRTRIYYNLTNTLKSIGQNYNDNITNRLTANANITTRILIPLVSELADGNLLIYNNRSTTVNVTYNLTNGTNVIGKDIYDTTNGVLETNNSNGTVVFMNVAPYSTILVLTKDIDSFQITSALNISNVYEQANDRILKSNHTNGVIAGAGASDAITIRAVEVWDKSYSDPTIKVFYGWLNSTGCSSPGSCITNPVTFNGLRYLVIADKNRLEVAKLFNTSNTNRVQYVFAYVAVADYNSSNTTWMASKRLEVDNWLALNSSLGILLDGLDAASVTNASAFLADIINLTDYVKITKGKELSINVFTQYQSFAQLPSANGFAMRESCANKWIFANGVNDTAGYNYSKQAWEDDGLGNGDYNKSIWYNTHNVNVVCVAFMNRSNIEEPNGVNYSQMQNIYFKAKVLGYDNVFISSPYFTTNRYDKYYDLGTKLQTYATSNGGGLYSMIYSKGTVYYNSTSDTAWFNDNRVFNGAEVNAVLYDNTPYTYKICVNQFCYNITTPGSGWSYNWYNLTINKTVFDMSYGHYLISINSTNGGYVGDDNIGNASIFAYSKHSFFWVLGNWSFESDATGNHMINLMINDTYRSSLGTTNKIRQIMSETLQVTVGTINAMYNFLANIWSYPITATSGTFRSASVWNGTAYVVMTNYAGANGTATCNSTSPTWAYNNIPGVGSVGICLDGLSVRFVFPKYTTTANSTQFELDADDTGPVMAWENPTPADNNFSTAISLAINVSALDANLANITVRVYTNITLVLRNMTNRTTTPLYINYTNLTDGTYYYNATACDIYGVCSGLPMRTYIVDRVTPVITMITPTNNSRLNASTVYVNYTMRENNTYNCWYVLNGSAKNIITCGSNLTFTNPGNYNITITINDSTNKQGNGTVYFIIDRLAPNATNILPIDGGYSNLSTAALPLVIDRANGIYNGTAIGGVIINSSYAKFGNGGAKFDGINDYITLNANVTPAQNYTICAWFNASNRSSQDSQIYGSDVNNRTYLFVAGSNGNVIGRFGNPVVSVTSSVNYYGLMTYACIVSNFYSGILMNGSLYVNGNLIGSSLYNATSNSGTSSRIGYLSGIAYFNGSIDEVRIFNRNLSQVEITALYTNTNPTTTGLVAYYDMEPDPGYVAFTAELSDTGNAGLANATLYVYNASGLVNRTTTSVGVSTLASETYATTVMTVVRLADGIYTWFYDVMDFATNMFRTQNDTFTQDTIAPQIDFDILSEINLSYINRSNAVLSFDISDTNLMNLTIMVYKDNGAVDGSYAWGSVVSGTYTTTDSPMADGRYTFNASVCDPAGNCNSTGVRNFTIDTATPLVSFVFPTTTNNSYFNNSKIEINTTVSDVNLMNVTTTIFNLVSVIVRRSSWNMTTNETFYYNSSGLTDGNYTFNTTACDQAGNCNATETRVAILDSIPPVVSVPYPVEANIYTGVSIPTYFTYSFTDLNPTFNGTINSCRWSYFTTPSPLFTCSAPGISQSISVGSGIPFIPVDPAIGGLADGPYTWTVNVTDLAGNTGTTSRSFVVNRTFNPTVTPTSPSGGGGASTAENQIVNFSANVTAPLDLSNITLHIYNTTNYSTQPYYENTTLYTPGTQFDIINRVIFFIRGTYYWWFDTYDSYTNYAASNVSNLSISMAELNIVSPLNNSRNFSSNNLVYIIVNSTQVMDSCKYSINGVANQSIAPLNFWMTPAYGANNIHVYCRNINGTAETSVDFNWYPSPSLALIIITPKNGQYYRDATQKLSISYNTSFNVPYLNLSLNGAPWQVFTNGQNVIFPEGNNVLRVRVHAVPPYAFPYDVFNAEGIEETAEVRFTTGSRTTGAFTDMMIYFWSFMFFGMLAIVFAYLKESEDSWQFFMRTIWYLMEMLIGFGVIVESIKFIRTITGAGGG